MLYLLDKGVRTVRWNGLPLHEAESAIVKEEVNGDFTLTVRYPITDTGIYQLIKEDMLIKAPTPVLGPQLFRIKKPVENDDNLDIVAYHITDDIMQRSIKPMGVVRQGCMTALTQMIQAAKTSVGDFSFFSDITENRTFNTKETETLYTVLLDGKHSIVGTWEGELVRDNLALSIKKSRGSDRGVIITTHKNLKSYQRTKDSQGVVTRIHARSTFRPEGAEEDVTLKVSVDSPLIHSYPYIHEREYENNNAKTIDELRKWAEAKFRHEGIDKISDAIKIEAYELDGQVIHLGDTVNLKSRKHRADVYKKAIAYEFNCLANDGKGEYISITFDDKPGIGGSGVSSGLSHAADTILGVSQTAQDIAIERAIQNANAAFDAEFNKRVEAINDSIEQVKAKSEEFQAGLHSAIDEKIAAGRREPYDLAQSAKRIAEEAKRDLASASERLEETKRELRTEIANIDVNVDVDVIKRRVTGAKNVLPTHISRWDFGRVQKDSNRYIIVPPIGTSYTVRTKDFIPYRPGNKYTLINLKDVNVPFVNGVIYKNGNIVEIVRFEAGETILNTDGDFIQFQIRASGSNYTNAQELVKSIQLLLNYTEEQTIINDDEVTQPIIGDGVNQTTNVPREIVLEDRSVRDSDSVSYNELFNNETDIVSKINNARVFTISFDVLPRIENETPQIRVQVENTLKDVNNQGVVARALIGGKITGVQKVTSTVYLPSDYVLDNLTLDILLKTEYQLGFKIRNFKLELGEVATPFDETGSLVVESKKLLDRLENNVSRVTEKFDSNGELISLKNFKTTVEQTDRVIHSKLTQLEEYKNTDGTRQSRILRLAEEKTAELLRREMVNVDANYVGKQTLIESIQGVERTIEEKVGESSQRLAQYTQTNSRSLAELTQRIEQTNGTIAQAKTRFEQTAQSLQADLSAVQSYVSRDGTRTQAMQEYVRTETAAKTNALRTEIGQGYVSNSRLTETVSGLERRFESLQIGGRNYVLSSDTEITIGSKNLYFSFENDLQALRGKTVTTSFYAEISGMTSGRVGFESSIVFTDGTVQYLTNWITVPNFKGRNAVTHTIWDKPIRNVGQRGMYLQHKAGTAKISRPKFEFSSLPSDWSPAPEDNETFVETKIATYAQGVDGNLASLRSQIGERVTTSVFNQKLNEIKQSVTDLNGAALKHSEVSITSQGVTLGAGKTIGATTISSILTTSPDSIQAITDKMVITANQQNLVKPSMRQLVTSQTRDLYVSDFYDVEVRAGDEFFFQADVTKTATGGNHDLNMLVILRNSTDRAHFPLFQSKNAPLNSKQRVTGTLKIPSNQATAQQFRIGFQQNTWSNYTTWKIENIQIYKKSSAELIVDGSITGRHIMAGTIEGGNIKGGTITGNLIATEAISASHIKADNAFFEKLVSEDILAGKLFVKEAFATQVKGVTADISYVKTGTITSKNGEMKISVDTGQILYYTDQAAIKRVVSGYPTQFVKFKSANGSSVTVIGSNRNGTEIDTDDSFAGIKISSGRDIEKIEVISDTVDFLTGSINARGWRVSTLSGEDNRQVTLRPIGSPTRSYIYASHFLLEKSNRNLADAISALFELWDHYKNVDKQADDVNFRRHFNKLKNERWY